MPSSSLSDGLARLTSRWRTPPIWLSVFLGSLPVAITMAMIALPGLKYPHDAQYHLLFLVAYAVCSVPLVWVQQQLWRRHIPLWLSVLMLLVLSYALSVANNAVMVMLADHWGEVRGGFQWAIVLRGLAGTWMALMAFCVFHAGLTYYFELRDERQRVYEAAALARDAELRALRYQVHPHFLFNTLNAISSLVAVGRTREATQMISRLGDFFRATLESGEVHEVSLAHELSLTEHYLDIEKARLGDRLTVTIQVGPDAMSAAVPYLLLQPLVENAIRHGIAQRHDGGHVAIGVTRVEDRLHLHLDNDGMPDSTVESGSEPRRSSAIGLRNVRERLERLYEHDHRMELDVAENGSCRVRIELPYRPLATS
jgi:two-component system sensor histidine kinase AlgZ